MDLASEQLNPNHWSQWGDANTVHEPFHKATVHMEYGNASLHQMIIKFGFLRGIYTTTFDKNCESATTHNVLSVQVDRVAVDRNSPMFQRILLDLAAVAPPPQIISKMYFSLWKTPGVSERMWSVN
jgi:hypothetical protein